MADQIRGGDPRRNPDVVQIYVMLPAELYARLRRICAADLDSVSHRARCAIASYVPAEERRLGLEVLDGQGEGRGGSLPVRGRPRELLEEA